MILASFIGPIMIHDEVFYGDDKIVIRFYVSPRAQIKVY